MEDRYARQVMLPQIGEAGQKKLAGASVLIVGLGGLGSPAALYLTAAGVGRIGLADPDRVSESNLQRQILYDERQAGTVSPDGCPTASHRSIAPAAPAPDILPPAMLKVVAAHERLQALSSQTIFEKYPAGLTAENAADLISRYDLVLDCCDNFATRYLLDDACTRAGKPWVHGSIGEFSGQVTVLNYRRGKHYADLYPDREALCAREKATAGVLGPTAGVLGTLQAFEALKILSGFGDPLDGRLLCLDLLTLETTILDF